MKKLKILSVFAVIFVMAMSLRAQKCGVATSGDKFICQGSKVQLWVDNGFTSYHWSPTVGLDNPNSQFPWASPTVTTTYTVTATVKNPITEEYYSPTGSLVVTVEQFNFSISSDMSICLGDSAVLVSSGADKVTWSALDGSNSLSGLNVKVSPTYTTKYAVYGETADGKCNSTKIVQVVVKNIPLEMCGDIAINYCVPQRICAGNGYSTYQWSPTYGLQNPNVQSPLACPMFTTTYTVTATKDGCKQTGSLIVNVSCKNSVKKNNGITAKVYQQNGTIQMELPYGKYQIELYDNLGQMIQKNEFEGEKSQVKINTLAKGLYLLKVSSKEKSDFSFSKKILL